MSIKTYSEMILLPTFEERFEYLDLNGIVGDSTFGFDRYVNQKFYKSPEWQRTRHLVIIRDNGCDLGCPDHPIGGRILIHHMNPIRQNDITDMTQYLMNPEYLICVAHDTHNAIHFGDKRVLERKTLVERKPGDTDPWY